MAPAEERRAPIRLATAELRVEIDSADGGKVTRLRCERHEREWLAGPSSRADADADEFGASRSWGWDELFPTVLAMPRPPAPWRHALRDHGELWGRPWKTLAVTPVSATLRFDDPAGVYRFTRSLTLRGAEILACYELTNLGDEWLTWLWSMHPIISVAHGDELEVPGARSVLATHVRPGGRDGEGHTLRWPVSDAGLRLDRIAPYDGVTALKLYAGPRSTSRARIAGRQCALEIASDVPYLGIYINLGGWPGPRSGLHQLGIEPTSSAADDLRAAIAGATHRTSAPGEVTSWSVALRLGGDADET